MDPLRRTGHSANITWYAEEETPGIHAEVLCGDVIFRDGHSVRPVVPEFHVRVVRQPQEIGTFNHTPARRPANGPSGRPELSARTVTALVRRYLNEKGSPA